MFVKVFDENGRPELVNTDCIAVIQTYDKDVYTIHLNCAIDSMDKNTVLFRRISEELEQMLL